MASQGFRNKDPLIINLSSDKDLDCELCSKMVIGVIKHILYNREQIPQPFEQLIAQCDLESTTQVISVAGSKQRINNLKMSTMVASLNELFNHLVTEMKAERDIGRVVVVLGTTFMSPREVHCIEIPRYKTGRVPLGSNSSRQNSVSQMFRSLFISSGAICWPPLSPTNVHVLLQMRAHPKNTWFLPKSFYKLPENNSRLTIYRWNCSSSVPLIEEPEPVRPLTAFELYMSPATSLKPQQNSAEIIDRKIYDDELLWFLTPISIKGFS